MEKSLIFGGLGELEVRKEGSVTILEGYAAKYGVKSRSFGGNYFERIERGAFDNSLANDDDVRFLYNHDLNNIFARTRSGTLKLKSDDIGLKYRANISPEDPQAKSLLVKVERGDVFEMSFGFFAEEEDSEVRNGENIRVLKRVKLVDVSAVGDAQYPSTEIELKKRSLEKIFNKTEEDNEEAEIRQFLKEQKELNLRKYKTYYQRNS